jgi:NAD-dependent SIR2 family protein deacetylase
MRSMLGWPRVAAARPNTGHRALAALERAGALVGIITQNVDRLHQRAGSQHIVELHGALAEVLCLACGEREPRAAVQERLLAANRALHARAAAPEHAPGPDGDTEVPAELLRDFRVPTCLHCDGILKPDVVFFGGSVPRPRVARCQDWIERAAALLVVGSSLAVFSGLRFVRQAAARGIPVAILNRGPTRGDPLATLRLDAGAGPTLERLATLLGCRS